MTANQHEFAGFDAKRLTLWHVTVPAGDETTLQNLVLKNDPINGIQKLPAWKEISSAFAEPPTKDHIHIIVEPPTPPGELQFIIPQKNVSNWAYLLTVLPLKPLPLVSETRVSFLNYAYLLTVLLSLNLLLVSEK